MKRSLDKIPKIATALSCGTRCSLDFLRSYSVSCKKFALESESEKLFRQMLFSKIVPAVKRCGLLSPRQRVRFEQLGILQFESAEDPFESLQDKDLVPLAVA